MRSHMSHRYKYQVSLFPVLMILSAIYSAVSVAGSSPGSTLLSPSDCGSCVGHQVLYECTTVGIGHTVWEGTAFTHCSGGKIILSHSLFSSSGTMDTCNNGAIVGQSIMADGNCYTSQLNVTVNAGMNGQTVVCVYNNGVTESTVGTSTIMILEDPLPTPNQIYVVGIDLESEVSVQRHITFNWSTVHENCPAIHYNITAMNCGTCPSTVTSNQATCHSVSTGHVCSFAVDTVTCGNIIETQRNSATVTVTLKVPNPPTSKSVPLYSAETGHLKSITTTFEQVESFIISGEFDGSASSYTITYFETLSNKVCSSTTISSSSCESGRCNHLYEASDSLCPPCADISVTVFATNILGNGTSSDVITIGGTNQFVEVEFDSLMSSVRCMFKHPTMNEKSCRIVYGSSEQCTNFSQNRESSETTLNSATIKDVFTSHSQGENTFCSTITASDGSMVARIEAIISAGCSTDQLTDGTLLPDDISCGAPFHSLGIKNGMVCFGSVDVGATALYYCSSCDRGEIRNPSVRICSPNGTWNGSIPECECANPRTPLQVGSVTIISVGLALTLIICTLIAIIIILARARNKVQSELNQLKLNANVIYDEIPTCTCTSVTESTRNVAYASSVGHSTKNVAYESTTLS